MPFRPPVLPLETFADLFPDLSASVVNDTATLVARNMLDGAESVERRDLEGRALHERDLARRAAIASTCLGSEVGLASSSLPS